MKMSEIIEIDEEAGQFVFSVQIVPTMTRFTALIGKEHHERFSDRSWNGIRPAACPFLRPSDGIFACTIHETRPSLCRTYFCRD
jgi:Fe-S-cluster containining protein